jgi:hypothetical protein
MNAKISKKQIITTVETAVNQALSNLEIASPSKKTKKVINKVSKKLSVEFKRELKKQFKLTAKKAKGQNGKSSKLAGSKGQLIQAS